VRADLDGKGALVTGGGRGIGRGIALELARAGAKVVVADLQPAQAEEVAREIRSAGGSGISIQLDVADDESVKNCIKGSIEALSGIDILVNNAGVFQNQLGFNLNDEDFNICLDINLTGTWRMVRAIVPHFQARRGGKIINIASVGGREGVGFAPAYCASKAGVINLTQSLAAELAPYNVNVNTVCPGSVSTAMQERISTLTTASGTQSNGLRFGPLLTGPLTAEDIGHAVVFFASDRSRNITGQALNVDCGYLMN